MDSNAITIEEAASRMAVPPAWVKAMIERGQLQAAQHGPSVLVDACEIAASGWDLPLDPIAAPMGNAIRISAIVGAMSLH